MYDSLNMTEVLSGTNNTTHPVYTESTQLLDVKNKKSSMQAFKSFLVSIENCKKDLKLDSIDQSKGDVAKLKEIDAIKDAITLLEDAGVGNVKYAKSIFEYLETNKSLYMEGYEKNSQLVKYEYEAAAIILMDVLSQLIFHNIALEVGPNGLEVKAMHPEAKNKSMLLELAKRMADMMAKKQHKQYLDVLLKAQTMPKDKVAEVSRDSIKTEATTATGDTFDKAIETSKNLASMIWNVIAHGWNFFSAAMFSIQVFFKTLFGIVPIIRGCIYYHYNRKVSKILKLEESINFLKEHIAQLRKTNDMDPAKKEAIIKKQEAVVAMWEKLAAKRRAEFITAESQTEEEIKKNDQEIRDSVKNSKDDEFNVEF